MNFLKTIIFIGLAMILINCGSHGKNDGRIILSSKPTCDTLRFPDDTISTTVVIAQNLGIEIAKQLDSILRVDNISFDSELLSRGFFSTTFLGKEEKYFLISFTAHTNKGDAFGFKCEGSRKTVTSKDSMVLKDCESNQALIKKLIIINMGLVSFLNIYDPFGDPTSPYCEFRNR